MARVCLFGGSFDPPHLGHLEAALYAEEKVGLTRVLFVPTNVSYHKKSTSAAFAHRLSMLELLIEAYPSFQASAIDKELGGVTYTYRTLEAFSRRLFRDDELFFLMGADSMQDFHNWKLWRRILELARPIAVARPGHRLRAPGLDRAALSRFIVLDGFSSDCSSSRTRKRIGLNRPTPCLPGKIRRYILDHRLYLEEQQ